jgi:hypothetical protein
MGIFGDTAYDLLGFTDPRKKLMASIAAPQGAAPAPVPPNKFQPTMAQGGMGPDQQNPPPAPPQPQSYTSAPDFSKMYLDMLNRQEGSDAVDRGMGLLFAGFAQPQDRAGMVNAMSAGSRTDPGSMINEMQKAQLDQGKIEARAQMLAHAPELAIQLKMPVQQVIAAINSGAMDDIIKENQKTTILQASPLYHAQTDVARTEADLHRNQAELERAKITLANATLPSEINKAKEEVGKLQDERAKIVAETGAVPSLIEQRTAETGKTRAETGAVPSLIEQRTAATDKAKAETAAIPTKTALEEAQARAADAAALNSATTGDIKDYQFYAEQEKAAGRTPLGFGEFQRKFGGKATPKHALQVTWRTQTGPDGKPVLDENGNPVMEGVQLSDTGDEPLVVKGAIVKAQRTDTGTGWTYINPYTSQPIGAPISKHVEEVAKEKAVGGEEGKAEAAARTGLESKLATIDGQIKILSDVVDDPNLGSAVGARNPKRLLGPTFLSDADNQTRTRIGQAQALNIASIASTLRDAGVSRPAVAEVMAAASAVNRLKHTELSEEDYRTAGKEAIAQLKKALAVAYDEAGVKRRADLKDIATETAVAPKTKTESNQPTTKKKVVRNPNTGKLEIEQ